MNHTLTGKEIEEIIAGAEVTTSTDLTWDKLKSLQCDLEIHDQEWNKLVEADPAKALQLLVEQRVHCPIDGGIVWLVNPQEPRFEAGWMAEPYSAKT